MDRAKDGQPKPTEVTEIKSPSKRQLAADDADYFEPVTKRIQHQQQQVVLDTTGPQPKKVRFDSVALEVSLSLFDSRERCRWLILRYRPRLPKNHRSTMLGTLSRSHMTNGYLQQHLVRRQYLESPKQERGRQIRHDQHHHA